MQCKPPLANSLKTLKTLSIPKLPPQSYGKDCSTSSPPLRTCMVKNPERRALRPPGGKFGRRGNPPKACRLIRRTRSSSLRSPGGLAAVSRLALVPRSPSGLAQAFPRARWPRRLRRHRLGIMERGREERTRDEIATSIPSNSVNMRQRNISPIEPMVRVLGLFGFGLFLAITRLY